MRAAPQGTQVVKRIATILKSFSADRPEWRLSDLASAVSLPKSTTHRLLVALESEGFVRYDPGSYGYKLGPTVASMGRLASPGRDLRTLAQPLMESLSRVTGETCTLEILDSGQMLIAAAVLGAHVINATGEVGTRWPLHATSSGKAVLSHVPSAGRNELLERSLESFTPRTITDRTDLASELERSCKRGYATTTDELEIGYSAASAAVTDETGAPTAALCLGGPTSRFGSDELRDFGALLAQAADELSTGFRAPEGDSRPKREGIEHPDRRDSTVPTVSG